MQIIRTLNVTSTEFYNWLEKQLLAEIQTATGQVLAATSIKKGLTYTKSTTKSAAQLKIMIDDYQRGIKYQMTAISPLDTVTVTYLTTAKGAQTTVTFLEEIDSYQPQRHHWLLRTFSQTLLLGRMSDNLLQLEQQIIDHRVVPANLTE
ncbi:DUF3284 domain-containing protein [Lactiplantibacillus paraplantarum]|uniref:DUF3284 domain-containing protein n=1 Tax=Lactiplantibacillus paraplantarum TaxID=60520 RepID=A0A2I9DM21_9LACO|nr:DUF3284 domain-containing protein [Lactiplantibacillus paraplantarum]AVW10088.1 DUF3284 domain-containing protein [Lactiplantibacillus paraplantarum]AYJ38337.1 DUF3284 domain-containing protein [Lactiplantibacillus paraplantarum]ERL44334.1 hypothetical protein N644_1619 [Lactiplantibacillus paraplantarum]KRL49959.1 hypothetical protein FD48_GL002970 [Lactiplantibacillus paraplantarum DSM 10667]MDL2062639.1 DUF3284 domain-containing protein [Lactiplantibacillus paraplantarum]